MSEKNINSNIQNSYIKNNRIRTKLLLFIDNEIQCKIKQNIQNLKFNNGNENEIKISFEETFIQNQKYEFSFSNTLKTKKNFNSDKSFSTIDDSSNKNNNKSYKNERYNTHSNTISEVNNCSNKLFNNIINFKEKIYSIKNLSRQSSTFLILPKQKNASEYLKSLCNNLKICKNDKNSFKTIKYDNINNKLSSFSQDKKRTKKSNKILKDKNEYTHSLFRKSHKKNFVFNSNNQLFNKSNNLILIKFK